MSRSNGATPSRGMYEDSLKEATNQSNGLRMTDLNTKDKQPTTDESERILLVERERRVSNKTAYRLRTITLIVSWISVIYLGIMGIAMCALAVMNSSSSAFAFALDALLDCLSSLVVIWRFWGSAASLYSAKREKVACVALGVLFIVSFISICTRSAVSLEAHERATRSETVWVLSLCNSIVCFALLVIKTILARKLQSISIATDAVNSGIGVIVALSTVVSDVVYKNNKQLWYIDPVIGIICSVFLLGYGIWVIVYELRFAKHVDDSPDNSGD